ncbi:hypothetical protein M514_02533 [Trichuris suis]|uniref:Uncharacterized protein n=1 Tax=Trichuris suis TaxID=68888 RepID=A0A085NNB2_9BILA|nr:hypothetical protein M513_02533 [Trichuris suis]KFD70958.1 hypothetical protein M514_02533 [Trichuris suis]
MTTPSDESAMPADEQGSDADTFSLTGEEILAKIAEILGAHYSSYVRLLKRWFYRRESHHRLKDFVNKHLVGVNKAHIGSFKPNALQLLKTDIAGRARTPVAMGAQLEKASRTVATLPQETSRDIVFQILMWAIGISAFGKNAREYLIDAIEVELRTLMEELVRISRFRASIAGGNEASSSVDSPKVIMRHHLNDLLDIIDIQHFSPRPPIAY